MNEPPYIIYIGPRFQEDHSLRDKRDCLDRFEQAVPCIVDACDSVPGLMCQLANSDHHTDFVAVDLEYLHLIDCGVEGSSMLDVIRSLAVFLKLSKTPSRIVGVVGHDTDPELIRRALEVPEIWTLTQRLGGPWIFEAVVLDVRRYLSGDSTVPQAIRGILNTKPTKKTCQPQDAIMLTPRQNQVLDLVSNRGASNKAIARSLNISESTVKLHMSAILKKYGCRNRTQLAVFSRDHARDSASV